MSEKKRSLVLDSHALLAYYLAEPRAQVVREFLFSAQQRETDLYLSVVNWGEVIYGIWKKRGEPRAELVANHLRSLPVRVVDAGQTIARLAAGLKARYPLAYADCFAAALAQSLGREVPVLTGDPEFKVLEKRGEIKVEWLPVR